MFNKFRKAIFIAVAAACMIVSPSIARDARNAEISVDVISVTDNNPFKNVTASLSKIPGVKAAAVFGDEADKTPLTVLILPSGANAQRMVERALSGFSTSPETSLTGTVPFGKSLPFHVGTKHSYVRKVTSTVDDAGLVHQARQMAEVDEGIKMRLVPRLINNDFVLEYKLDVTKLTGPDGGFQKVSIGKDKVQLARTSQRSITQEISLPEDSGAVLYLTPGLRRNHYFVSIIRASKV